MTAGPQILAAPAEALIDTPLAIRVTGLAPRQVVTLRGRVAIPDGVTWLSWATFVADAAGGLDLSRDVPLAGTYRIADADGLLWSLAAHGSGHRLPTSGRYVESGLQPYRFRLSVEDIDGAELAETTLTRLPVAADILRRPVDEAGVVGTLFLPPEDRRRHRAVIVVPGSNGGIPEQLAALYASHGHPALALGYFGTGGVGGLPEDLMRIPLEYFENAIGWFTALPEVAGRALAFDGSSRGGELALLLGSMFPQIGSVVAWVPSSHLHRAFGPPPDGMKVAAWTWRGKDLPFVPPIRRLRGSRDADLEHGVPVPHVEDVNWIASHPGFEAARIPVERTGGPILLLSGRDDVMWPSATYCDWIVERLHACGFPHEVQHLSYQNAGHTIGPPGSPATELFAHAAGSPRSFPVGGTPEGIARARAALWPQVLAFLARP